MTDDAALLRRFAAQRRDEDFAELVRRHLGLVYRAALCRTNGDAHLAEDVAQQVFVTLARSAAEVQHHAVLAGWLYVATRNAAANAMRTEQRRRVREQEAHAMIDPPSSPDPQIDWEQLRPELDRVMDELPERDRHAVLLRFFANQPFAEIGGILQVSENAARMRVDRALERLRALLAKRGIASTSAALGSLLAAQASAAVPSGLAATVTGAALASAGTAAGVAVAGYLLSFMSTTKVMTAVASVIVCGAIGTAIYETSVAREAQAEFAVVDGEQRALRSELAKLAARAEAAEQQIRKAEGDSAALRQRLDEVGAPDSADGSTAKAQAQPIYKNGLELAATDPAYRKLLLEQQLISYPKVFGRLYRKLRLSPQQIADFEQAQLTLFEYMIDRFAATLRPGASPTTTDPTQDPAVLEANNTIYRVLGDQGLAEWQANASVEGSPWQIDNFASNLYYTDTPLTADQGERLMQLLAANTVRAPIPGSEIFSGKTDWASVYAQAAGLLAPSQLETIKLVVEQQRLLEASTALMETPLSVPGAADCSAPKSGTP